MQKRTAIRDRHPARAEGRGATANAACDTCSVVIEIVERGGDRRGPWLLEVAGDQDAQVVRGGAVRCP